MFGVERTEIVGPLYFSAFKEGDFFVVYLKSDVLMLAEIFENFRTTCMESYNLDPAHYCTLPELRWDAMLKYTQISMISMY